MKRLWFLEPGKLEWRDAEMPVLLEPEDAIVRPIASTTCDLDVQILRGHASFQGPIAFGHECVAEIVSLGEGARSLHVGQIVVVPWHVSCGQCDRCRGQKHNACRSFPGGAMYGMDVGGDFGSFFSDYVRVPHAAEMLVPLPAKLDPAACAAASDNLPFGYEMTIPHLAQEPGSDVLIVGGCGSIGLYAAAFAVAGGARQVHYADTDPDRLARAERYGAKVIEGPPPRRMGQTYPITVDASSSLEGLRCAILSTEREGTCSSVGVFGDVAVPMAEMYSKGIHFHTGRGKGFSNIAAALEFVSARRVDPTIATTAVVPFDEADTAFADPSMKMVMARAPIVSARGSFLINRPTTTD